MGDNLYPSRESNPKGFFENDVINGINERILSHYDYIKIQNTNNPPAYQSSPFNPLYGQRWLSYIEPETSITYIDDSIVTEIQKVLSVPVYAYKDPRFTFTLPIWNRFLPSEIVYICMFRQPDITVESVIKDCTSADYLKDFYIDCDIIFKLWYNSYQRVLKNLNEDTNLKMIFVNYEQLLSKDILPELSKKLDVDLDSLFISPDLNRSRSSNDSPQYALDLYKTLCGLSGL